VLAARIKDAQVRAQQSQMAATRKSLVGSGDRSERIRTYNFPQGRVTDHRINLTLYKIAAIMDGDLYELTDALQWLGAPWPTLLAQLARKRQPHEHRRKSLRNAATRINPSMHAAARAVRNAIRLT
jgi:hypothetical protein